MSAPARHLHTAPPPALPGPALVPVTGDRVPRIEVSPGKPRPVNAHRLFFGMWYVALGMFGAAACVGWVHRDAPLALWMTGGLFAALGGFGIAVHTLCKPGERKLRHALAAGAALALILASLNPLRAVSAQVYATWSAARLQPLAESLARDPRIRNVGGGAAYLRLNGFQGTPSSDDGRLEGRGEQTTTLSAVLARDGITRGEIRAYREGLRRGGMKDAWRTDGSILFIPVAPYGLRLLYVPSGKPLPEVRHLKDETTAWRSQPLGGGWYVLRRE